MNFPVLTKQQVMATCVLALAVIAWLMNFPQLAEWFGVFGIIQHLIEYVELQQNTTGAFKRG